MCRHRVGDAVKPITGLGIKSGWIGSGQELPALMYSSTTANAFGTWAEIGKTPPWPTKRLFLFGRSFDSALTIAALINIGIGPTGSQRIILSDLSVNLASTYRSGVLNGYIPVKIPSNQILWAQMATNSTTRSDFELGALLDPLAWGPSFSLVTSYVDVANSSGNIVTGASTSGAYTSITIPSFGPHKAYFFLVAPNGNVNYQSYSVEISIGSTILFPETVVLISNGPQELTTPILWGPFDCSGLGGSNTLTISGHYTNGTAGDSIQIGLYGLD